MRVALGAGRWRVVRQLLTESLTLAGMGGALGLLVGWCGVRLFVAWSPSDIPRLADVDLDWAAFGFTFGLSMLTGLCFGLVPAWQCSRIAPNEALNTLAKECERAARRAGLKPEARKYTPHVTLAYLARPDLERVIAFERNHALFESRAWRVERFGLYSSHQRKSAPNLYRLEADYALNG